MSAVWSKPMLRAVFAASMAVALLAPAVSSSAYAATCESLRRDLARIQSGKSSSPEVKKWQTASRNQKKAISAAERDARHFRCATETQTPKCKGLNAKIKKMKSNLRAIDKRLARAEKKAPGSSTKKRTLRAALAKKNCDAPKRQRTAKAKRAPKETEISRSEQGSTFFKRLFARSNSIEVSHSDASAPAIRTSTAQVASTKKKNGYRRLSGTTFRTLCVRTCDGYFFPVSFSTSKKQLPYDSARCSEMCPAAETELFVHRNPGEQTEDMISLQGTPYTDIINAYRFKTEYVEGCSCRAPNNGQQANNMTVLSDSSESRTSDGKVRVVAYIVGGGVDIRPSMNITRLDDPSKPLFAQDPLPRGHVSPLSDPDTRHNMEMGFNPAETFKPAETKTALKNANSPVPAANGETPIATKSSLNPADTVPPALPVFQSLEKPAQKAKPEPGPKGPIRVVGPEYFVAQ